MPYDVKNAALAFLQESQAAAERDFLSAKVEAMSKEGAFLFAQKKMMKLEGVVDNEQRFLGLCKHKRSPELSKRRAALREKKRELKAARAEMRKARGVYFCAESSVKEAESFLLKVERAYTHVKRKWLSGCVVRSKPCFNNLIPD